MLARTLFTPLAGAALALTALTTAALAGGPTTAVEETPVAAAPAPAAADWSGFYTGLAFAKPFGDNFWAGGILGDTTTEDWGGSMTTLSVGRDWQRGNLVYGLALSYGAGEYIAHPETDLLICADCDTRVDAMTTLRARLGFATDRTLVYLTAAAVRAKAVAVYTGGTVVGRDTLDGHAVGIGLEQRVGMNLSVTAEYLSTDLGRMKLPDMCVLENCHTDIKFNQVQIGLNYRW